MFGRWRNRTSEAENYLRATDTVSRPVAFLLTLAGFVILAALLFMVFLGGRWVYNEVRDRTDSDTAQDTEQQGEAADSDEQIELPGFVDEDEDEDSQDVPPQVAPGQTGGVADSGDSHDGEHSVPDTGPAIPDTGAGSVIGGIAVVFVVTVIGHQLYVRRYVLGRN